VAERERDLEMAEHTVVLRLNQQQLELIDRTVKEGVASDRGALIKRALAEHARKHLQGRSATLNAEKR
jgi:hypothetical protein